MRTPFLLVYVNSWSDHQTPVRSVWETSRSDLPEELATEPPTSHSATHSDPQTSTGMRGRLRNSYPRHFLSPPEQG